MEEVLIKNGNVLLFENNDVVIKKINVFIKNGKIEKIFLDDEKSKIYEEYNISVSEGKDNNLKNLHIIDATNKIVMPGLINVHAHIPMSIFRETTEGYKLYEWLEDKIWPVEDKLTEEDVYYASMLSYIEMISTGTTCVNDHYFISNAIRKAAEDSKVRTVLTRVLMDSDGENGFKQRVKEFENLYETRNKENELITYTVSPHSMYTCSEAALEKSEELSKKYNLPVHIHFLESIDEIEDIKNKHGMTAIEVLKKYFSNIHTILAHGVKINNDDLNILKDMNIAIVHNPVSNMRLGCKIADITKYLKNNINVCLGTDGQGSGSNLDMFEAMRVACLIQGGIHENEERINAKDVIKMATINGAKALQKEDEIGSIEEGKDADIILVNIEESLDNITMVPNLNKIANLVYNTSGKNVDTTIVKGEILMENRNIKNIDVKEIINKCNDIIKRLF